jgi:hypothetical protein
MVKEGLARIQMVRTGGQNLAQGLKRSLCNGWSKIAHAWRSQDITDSSAGGDIDGPAGLILSNQHIQAR